MDQLGIVRLVSSEAVGREGEDGFRQIQIEGTSRQEEDHACSLSGERRDPDRQEMRRSVASLARIGGGRVEEIGDEIMTQYVHSGSLLTRTSTAAGIAVQG